MSASKLAITLGVPAVVGLVLGLVLAPVASSLSAPKIQTVPADGTDPRRVAIEEVFGEVWASSDRSNWRPVSVGDELHRPVTFKTEGLASFVRLTVKGARLVICQDAIAHLGAAGFGLTVQVDQGLLLAHRERQRIRAIVPLREVDVIGQAFGLWVRGERVNVAILDEDAEIKFRDAKPETFSFGREVTIKKGQLEPSIMASQLKVEIITERRVGSRNRIAARTAINAGVFAYGPDGFEEIDLTRGGTFAIQIPEDRPAPGTLIALDAAGRWAELAQPSRRLEQVLHDLKTGEDRRTHAAPPKIQREDSDAKRKRRELRRRRQQSADRAGRDDDDDDASGRRRRTSDDDDDGEDARRRRRLRDDRDDEEESRRRRRLRDDRDDEEESRRRRRLREDRSDGEDASRRRRQTRDDAEDGRESASSRGRRPSEGGDPDESRSRRRRRRVESDESRDSLPNPTRRRPRSDREVPVAPPINESEREALEDAL